MNNKNQRFNESIKRAEKGEFKEYWLHQYIKNNYKKLGFDSLEGPFETGYDFRGVHKGKRVIVEAERRPGDFLKHEHNSKEVDILIVLSDEDNGYRIRGMTREEWKKYLPKKIIKVDQEDFVKSTHEMRKGYAIKKQKERDEFIKSHSEVEKKYIKFIDTHLPIEKQKRILLNLILLPFNRIKTAFSILWDLLGKEIHYTGTPEAETFDIALDLTAIKYIKAYNLNFEELIEELVFTKIEVFANDLSKSRREYNDLTSKEKEFLEDWLEVLRTEYTSQI